MPPSDPGRVSLTQIAIELGIEFKRAKKLVRKHGWWLGAKPQRQDGRTTYDATVIEKLRGLLGQEHRQLDPPERDWLAQYEEKERNARNTRSAESGGRRPDRPEQAGPGWQHPAPPPGSGTGAGGA